MTTDGQPPPAPDPQRDPDLPIADPPQRVSGMRVPERWTGAGKPAELAPDAEDAWRQTGFLLADDLRLLAASLDLQVRLASAGLAPGARTMMMAAHASLWSRATATLSDAALLTRQGSYQGALPLARQAVELVAAQIGLEAEPDEFRRWAHEAYARDAETRAEDVGLGHYFSGSAIAEDDALRPIYRAAGDFGRPNFGPTALLVAGGANRQRYPLIFGDRAFHLGWAQLLSGWLLRIGARQLHAVLHTPQRFPASDELRAQTIEHVRAIDLHLDDNERCRLEEHTDGDGRRRHLILNYRRRPGDATKRLLL